MRTTEVRPNLQDLATVTELCEIGTIVPVIDRRYPLSQVPDALRRWRKAPAKGKLVITLD
jgi:NADPH:quinone reductase-like Zn-dependent oxidoreductase